MKIRPYYEVPYDEWLFTSVAKVKEGNPEEPVRQWALRELLETYKYPRSWIDEAAPANGRITIEEPVQVGASILWADIAIKNEFMEPYVFIETKKAGEDLAKPRGADSQLHSYIAVTLSARVGMATNGDDVHCWRKQFDPREEMLPHPDIPEYSAPTGPPPSAEAVDTESVAVAEESTSEDDTFELIRVRDDRLSIVPDFSKLLRRCHNVLRTEENLHADEALDEICKILFIKIYDELNTRRNKGEEFHFSQWRYSSPEELASSIRSMYGQAIAQEKARLRTRGIYERSRDVFDEEIRVKDSSLFHLVKLLQRYSVIDTNVDSRGRAFEQFLGTTFRHDLGQYFTPEPVVRLMVGLLDPSPTDMILDPACGSARFLSRCLHYVRERKIRGAYGDKVDDKKIQDFALYNLHGVEVSRRLVRVAVTDMIMYDDGHTNIRFIAGDGALSDFETFYDLPRESVTCVITNPPYGGDPVKDQNVLRRFRLGMNKAGNKLLDSRDKELLFLERCFQFLKPGGKLAILLHVGVLANKGTAWIREWYRDQGRLRGVIQLPNYTFTPYGAKGIETCVLLFEKWPSVSQRDDYPVFYGTIEDIGYTADGRVSRNPKYLGYLQDLYDSSIPPEEKQLDEIEEIVMAFHSEVGWDS